MQRTNLNFRDIIRNNLYFLVPFLVWVIIGGIMLIVFSRNELFFAVNGHHNEFMDKLNTVFSGYGRGDVIPIILLSLLLIPAYRNKNYIATTIVFGFIIPTIIFLAKLYFDTPRPLKFYGVRQVHTVPWLDNLFETSFPSGHTIGAFGFFLLLSLYLPKRLKIWSILFFILALSTAYSRLYLGQHFFSDVYGGSIIGTVITLVIYYAGGHIFKHKKVVHD